MKREALILAGGLGTRLREKVPSLPKVMAPILDRPFLEYQLRFLALHHFRHIVLSVGYKQDIIFRHFGNEFAGMSLEYAREPEPLGTGGGIMFGLKACLSEEVFILNGDTLFLTDPEKLEAFHREKQSVLSLSLKELPDASRYGSVLLDREQRINGFAEKGKSGKALINGGVYLLSKNWAFTLDSPSRFSFEKDLLEKKMKTERFFGMPSEAYFIDIGIPEEYERAKRELPEIMKTGF